MDAPTASSLSRLFKQLIGRDVAFVPTKDSPDEKIPQGYGIYRTIPDDSLIVVKADLPLLGSFAGALIGLPDSEVKSHLRVTPMDEPLRDAIYEVLNVSSGTIAPQCRAVLSKLVTDLANLDEATSMTLSKPSHKYCFSVSINGYQGGKFAVVIRSSLAPSAGI